MWDRHLACHHSKTQPGYTTVTEVIKNEPTKSRTNRTFN
jgi:hypothetical protein